MLLKKTRIKKTAHLEMKMKKNSIIKNIAFDNVDVKTCIKNTAHLKMKVKKTVL